MELFSNGIVASLFAGLATGLGAIPLLVKKEYSESFVRFSLNIAAGIMLAAAFFSLINPAITASSNLHADDMLFAANSIILSIFMGGFFIWALNHFIPHEHDIAEICKNERCIKCTKKVWLFIIAITIHNFPEGLAVGVGFGDELTTNPNSLVLGIALQNIPEGLAVAISLIAIKYSRIRAILIAFATGLAEPVGAIIGSLLINISPDFIPMCLAFAGGTMLFVIINEIIPVTVQNNNHKEYSINSVGLFIGFAIMMYLCLLLE